MRAFSSSTATVLLWMFVIIPKEYYSESFVPRRQQQQPLSRVFLLFASKIPSLVIVLPETDVVSQFGTASPVDNPTVYEVARHVGTKCGFYTKNELDFDTCVADDLQKSSSYAMADVVIALGLRDKRELETVRQVFESRIASDDGSRCQFAVDCAESLPSLVGPYSPANPPLSRIVPWTAVATGQRMHARMQQLFDRYTTDDFCYAVVLFLNQFVTPIDWVKYRTDATWEKGILQNAKEFYKIFTQCGDCVVPLLSDPQCRECIGLLATIDPQDQAAAYRALVSYESDLLTKFSLCVFTKHNIFECNAQIPVVPYVPPMTQWRNQPLTQEDAQSLLVGHLLEDGAPSGSLGMNISWKVACGANKAYDQFPSQNQIFYHAASGNTMWYDPVFRVETLDGRKVWCKRHYRVRPQKTPGTFRLSVSDNGVTSDEFWTIVGAADDLSWIVFHYAGAAKEAGLSYLGGLLCTPDGKLPAESKLPEIWKCFVSAGIQPWELYSVDNRIDSPGVIDAGPPPLDFYRQSVLELKDKRKSVTAL